MEALIIGSYGTWRNIGPSRKYFMSAGWYWFGVGPDLDVTFDLGFPTHLAFAIRNAGRETAACMVRMCIPGVAKTGGACGRRQSGFILA